MMRALFLVFMLAAATCGAQPVPSFLPASGAAPLPPLCPVPIAIGNTVTVPATTANGGTSAAIDTTGATDIIFAPEWAFSSTATINLSDSKSNTWDVLVTSGSSGSAMGTKIAHCHQPCTVGTGHTFTIAGTAIFGQATVAAVTGTNGVVAAYNGATGNQGTASSLATGYVTPLQNCMVAFTALGDAGATRNPTTPSGFTVASVVDTPANSQKGVLAYKIQTGATVENPNWTNLDSLNATTAAIFYSANTPVPPVYSTPLCSVTGSGCAEAWSMVRDMTGTMTNAIQLSNGSTTLNVGYTGHVIDLTTWSAFCSGVAANCVTRKIYAANSSTNDFVASTVSIDSPPGPACSGGTADKCASVFTFDITTNYPVATIPAGPSGGLVQYNASGTNADTVGIPSGSAARTWINVLKPRPQTDGTSCCGNLAGSRALNGISGTAENFIPGAAYDQFGGGSGGVECSVGHYCVVLDSDAVPAPPGFEPDYSDHLVANMIVVVLTYDTTNGTDFYVNGVHLGNWPESSSGPLNTGLKAILFGGGDTTNGPAGVTWVEGAVVAARLDQTHVTAVTDNIAKFYRMAVFP